MSAAAATDHFAARGGLALLHRHWRPGSGGAARLRLAIVHGLAEHSARYDHVGRFFARRGVSVHAYDQRGHGLSEGPRVYTPSFEHLLDDAERFLAHIERADPEGPLVLLGHSMGGLCVASLLAHRRPAVRAAVLSGPALARPEISRLQRALIGSLSALTPRLLVPMSLDAEGLSRDPEVVAAYLADPLVPRRYSARLIASLLRETERVATAAPGIELPVLIVHGEDDPICPVDGSRSFANGLAAAGSELKTYPGLRHEILNEPEREQVLADIHGWIEKRIPTGASA